MSKTTSEINQRIILRADANMKAEGFHATSDVKRDCIAMLEGKVSADELVKHYIIKHTQKET